MEVGLLMGPTIMCIEAAILGIGVIKKVLGVFWEELEGVGNGYNQNTLHTDMTFSKNELRYKNCFY